MIKRTLKCVLECKKCDSKDTSSSFEFREHIGMFLDKIHIVTKCNSCKKEYTESYEKVW